MQWDPADLVIALFGFGALLAGVLPWLVERRPFSMPIIFVLLGMVVFALPTPLPRPDPFAHPAIAAHLTELGVIIALMGAGLKIDRPMDLYRWMSTWRLVVIAMPLTVACVALLGWWWIGLAPAAALLLGGALAPTDPVLASDVDVGRPTEAEDSEDKVRFALTSEGGLTEALAFPFVYAALTWAATAEPPARWLLRWLSVDAAYKAAMGILGGTAVGWLLGRLFFRTPSEKFRLARHWRGSSRWPRRSSPTAWWSWSAATASSRSSSPPGRSGARSAGTTTTRCCTTSLNRSNVCGPCFSCCCSAARWPPVCSPALSWPAALTGLAMLLVIRPLVGRLALWGAPGYGPEHWVVAAFGIRGIGTLYYVSYALAHVADFPDAEEVWATAAFVVLVSVVVHGIAATPVMQAIDRGRPRPNSVPASGSTAA